THPPRSADERKQPLSRTHRPRPRRHQAQRQTQRKAKSQLQERHGRIEPADSVRTSPHPPITIEVEICASRAHLITLWCLVEVTAERCLLVAVFAQIRAWMRYPANRK